MLNMFIKILGVKSGFPMVSHSLSLWPAVFWCFFWRLGEQSSAPQELHCSIWAPASGWNLRGGFTQHGALDTSAFHTWLKLQKKNWLKPIKTRSCSSSPRFFGEVDVPRTPPHFHQPGRLRAFLALGTLKTGIRLMKRVKGTQGFFGPKVCSSSIFCHCSPFSYDWETPKNVAPTLVPHFSVGNTLWWTLTVRNWKWPSRNSG